MKVFDYVVVGSGCSGAMAAQTLVEAGKDVTMLDVGTKPDPETSKIPDADYLNLRTNDAEQNSYLVGKQAEGVFWGKVSKGEQITPPRKHLTELVDELIPITSDGFSSFESLAYGGLGAGWGLQSWQYSAFDMQQAGLPADDMIRAYNKVGGRIGISATNDTAGAYSVASLEHYQQPPDMDSNNKYIWKKYSAKRAQFKKQGFVMGRTPLALITKDYNGRKGYQYRDMDFYSDNDQSAWRPWMTVDELRQKSNFRYIDGYLLLSFKEKRSGIELHCLNVTDKSKTTFRCKRLVLATGALGSARIILRSYGHRDAKLPILCNPYHYVPCVQPMLMGRGTEPRKVGFTQLSLLLDEEHKNQDVSVASIYSYQSLMLFRIMRHVPLNFRDGREIMQYLSPGFVIMGVHHPDVASTRKYLELVSSTTTPTKDILKVVYNLSEEEKAEYRRREKKYLRAMRRMGTFGLMLIDPGYGAGIHYAGTVPFSEKDKPLTLAPNGRLHGTRNVFVADSSGYNYLPAKGLTFSIMANAHLVAENALRTS